MSQGENRIALDPEERANVKLICCDKNQLVRVVLDSFCYLRVAFWLFVRFWPRSRSTREVLLRLRHLDE
jgi:hypothetical protein